MNDAINLANAQANQAAKNMRTEQQIKFEPQVIPNIVIYCMLDENHYCIWEGDGKCGKKVKCEFQSK